MTDLEHAEAAVAGWMIEADGHPRGVAEWCRKDGLPSLRERIAASYAAVRRGAWEEALAACDDCLLVEQCELAIRALMEKKP